MKKNDGFTLLEILVVIAIMAGTMGLTIGLLGGGFERQAKKEAAHLAATIRFAYHASISGHVPHRILFDITENQYWVEVGSPESAVAGGPGTWGGRAADPKAEKTADTEEAPVAEGEEAPAAPDFVQSEEEIVRRVTLAKAVKIRDVQTARDEGPVTSGKATLYFFPTGFTEEAVIHLSNEDQTVNYSILVSPLTGTSRIEKDYVELEKTEIE